MTQKTSQKPRNIEGLHKVAQQKAEETRCRAEEAIALLLKQHLCWLLEKSVLKNEERTTFLDCTYLRLTEGLCVHFRLTE
jgi:hypothetical protein